MVLTSPRRSKLTTALARLWISSALLALAFAFEPLGVVYGVAQAGPGPGVRLVRRAGTLGGEAAAITETEDSERPYEVDGNTFTDYDSAAQRSCNIQFDTCQRIANTDSSVSFSLEDCQSQQDDCFVDPPAVGGDSSSATMGIAVESSDTSSESAESETTAPETTESDPENAPMTVAAAGADTTDTTSSESAEPSTPSSDTEPETTEPVAVASGTMYLNGAESESDTSAEDSAKPSTEPASTETLAVAAGTTDSNSENSSDSDSATAEPGTTDPDPEPTSSADSSPANSDTTDSDSGSRESGTTEPATTEAVAASNQTYPEPTLVSQTRIAYDAGFDLICDL